jgi:hypothetical protein
MRLSSIFAFLAAAFALLFAATGASAASCTAGATSTGAVAQSPNAVFADVSPYMAFPGGFGCPTGSPAITLLGANYLKVSISNTTYMLTHTNGTSTVDFKLAGASSGTPQLSSSPAFLVNGLTTDVQFLVGTAPTSVPLYIKPRLITPTAAPIAGVYTGTFKAKWEWSFCTGISIGVCIFGKTETGNITTDVTVTLTLGGVAPTISTVATTTWDDQNGTLNPKAIPGAKRRMTVTVGNPDIAVQDNNVVAVVVATPPNTTVALDGDGTSSVFAAFTDGSPASSLAFAYVSGTSSSDDVEFSSDNGSTWTFAPTAATQTSVTHVKLKTRGAMAAKSNFTVKLAYKVK